jgi:IPT/TIG domain-containing protein
MRTMTRRPPPLIAAAVLLAGGLHPVLAQNDACSGAIPVDVGRCGGSLAGATADGTSSVGNGQPDLWYTFQAPSAGTLELNTCGTHDLFGIDSSLDAVISVHAGCPGTISNELAANDDPPGGQTPCGSLDQGVLRDAALSCPMTAGQRVLIRLSQAAGATYPYFYLNVGFEATHPQNDSCEAPIPLREGSRVFSNVGATTDGPESPASCNFGADPQIGSDIWYCYAPSTSGTATVSLCETDFDTKLAVYVGCLCPSETPIACNDDACGRGSEVSFSTRARTTYMIRIGGYYGQQGSGVLAISCQQPPEPVAIAGFSPPEISYLGETPFEVRGSGFTTATTVTFAGVPVGATFVDGSTLRGTSPAFGPVEGTLAVTVAVSDPAGGTASLPNAFNAIGPIRIASVVPSSVLADKVGTVVTIAGMGFTPATQVLFGPTEASSKTFVDARTILAAVPSLPEGTYDVVASDRLVWHDINTQVRATARAALRSTPITADGFIATWLVLGPYTQGHANPADGAAPGFGIGADFLREGPGGATEATLVARDGLQVHTDFSLAAAKGILSLGGKNPGSVPTVFRWYDGDDTVLFDDVFGADVDDVVDYAFVYVTNETGADLPCVIGVASDDSILVDVDAEPVLAASVARSVGAAGTIQDRANVTLRPGEHRLLVKVFEGLGGTGFRLRFERGDGTPLTQGIRVSTVPTMTVVPPRLPRTLTLGSFTVDVDAITSYAWDAGRNLFTGMSGNGRTSLTCDGTPLSGIQVRFDDLTVQPGVTAGTGTVLAGSAVYPDPGIAPPPPPLQLSVEAFTVYFDALTLQSAGATARMRVALPPSIVNAGDGAPAIVALGERPIAAGGACSFYLDLPGQAFGPWRIGDTGIAISGSGLVLDLSRSQAYGPFPAPLVMAVLRSGTSAAASGIVSNIGYTRAGYTFADAVVVASGLEANLLLKAAYDFETAQPLGYKVSLAAGKGGLAISQSKVSTGRFQGGTLRLPDRAVRDTAQHAVVAAVPDIWVRSDMSFYGTANITQDLCWGSLDRSPLLKAYAAIQANQADVFPAYFFFSSTFTAPYCPLLPGGGFQADPLSGVADAAGAAAVLEAAGLQGLVTHFLPKHPTFSIFTPDVPSGAGPIGRPSIGGSWIAVGNAGVHGEMRVEGSFKVDLGPTGSPSYKGGAGGKVPFATTIQASPEHPRFLIRFADSAVYETDGAGKVALQGPTQGEFDIEDLGLTSTAHLVAAKVTLKDPMEVKYWDLRLEGKTSHDHAGVVAFKLGEVVFTAAGLEEVRNPPHFFLPLWLMWAEVFASGDWGQLFLDPNGAGQRFDSFPFAPETVSLSRYDGSAADQMPKVGSFLEVGGKVFFDFFGGRYLHIIDSYNGDAGAPSLKRDIALDDRENLADPANPFLATDKRVSGRWGFDFKGEGADYGFMDFSLLYDRESQDGFRGDGKVRIFFIDGDLSQSTIRMYRGRICAGAAETAVRNVDLVVADWGAMARTTGCACIANGRVERVYLSADLAVLQNVVVLAQAEESGMVEMILTPSTTEVRVSGTMFVKLVEGLGGDLQVSGGARFLTDFKEDFVDATFEGKVDASALVKGIKLNGEGGLNWHFGLASSWIQGRLKVALMASTFGGGAEGGFFLGLNAPAAAAHVLGLTAKSRCAFDPRLLPDPDHITGVYAYAGIAGSLNFYIISGGFEACAGVGAFIGSAGPTVTGVLSVRLWGEILGGLVGASGAGTFGLTVPEMYYQGSVELGGCVLWVLCASVDVTVGLNGDGFYID